MDIYKVMLFLREATCRSKKHSLCFFAKEIVNEHGPSLTAKLSFTLHQYMPSGTTCIRFQLFKSHIDKMQCVRLQPRQMQCSHGRICWFVLPIDVFPSHSQVVAANLMMPLAIFRLIASSNKGEMAIMREQFWLSALLMLARWAAGVRICEEVGDLWHRGRSPVSSMGVERQERGLVGWGVTEKFCVKVLKFEIVNSRNLLNYFRG